MQSTVAFGQYARCHPNWIESVWPGWEHGCKIEMKCMLINIRAQLQLCVKREAYMCTAAAAAAVACEKGSIYYYCMAIAGSSSTPYLDLQTSSHICHSIALLYYLCYSNIFGSCHISSLYVWMYLCHDVIIRGQFLCVQLGLVGHLYTKCEFVCYASSPALILNHLVNEQIQTCQGCKINQSQHSS